MRVNRLVAVLVSSATVSTSVILMALPPAQADALGCDAGVESDFNGDGRSDTVVSDSLATVGGQTEAGRAIVLYGDADGLVGEGSRGVINQGLNSIGGVAESGDHFGSSLAVADADCDGFTDLLVGAPQEDISSQSDSGYAQLIYGAIGGLGTGKASINFTQSTFGEPVTAGDNFGAAVDAVEDVGQGGTPAPSAYALAIGAPGKDVAGKNDAGWVGFKVPLDGGNVDLKMTLNSPGVAGVAAAGDRFGSSVSLNFLTGDLDTIDCAVGAPGADAKKAVDAGSVTILRDLYDAPTGVRISQNTPGVPDTAERGDQFGRTLDSIQVGANTRLAIGTPAEDIGKVSNTGSVQLFSSNGAALKAGPLLTQNTKGVADSAERGDGFGLRLRWVGPGLGDASTRLAVSAPKENLGAIVDAGKVQVFVIGALGNEKNYTQSTPGVGGEVRARDAFGLTLAAVEGATERILMVGVPDDTTYTEGMVNVIPFNGGTPRDWRPGLSGIPTGGGVRFGSAIATVTG